MSNEGFFKIKLRKLCFAFIAVSFAITLFVLSNVSESEEIAIQPQVYIPITNKTFIYVVTPTYERPVQKAELTRLSHTLRLVPDLHWIIVEDAKGPTQLVTNLLKNSKLIYTQLHQVTPSAWKVTNSSLPENYEAFMWNTLPQGRMLRARGVLQRNAALMWIRKNLKHHENGVIYFADDDNTYSLELFEEMRKTKRVSIWPVGLVGGLLVEKPIVENGKVVSFNSAWRPERNFPIDMAGFAVSLKHLLSRPKAMFSLESEGGFQETDFLSYLTTRDELEPMAANCTKILVWHTRTEKPTLVYEKDRSKKGLKPSNYDMEL